MPPIQLVDETGAQQVFGADTSRQIDIGNATPTAPISIDGSVLRKSGSNTLGDTRAASASSIKTTGSASVGSGATHTVTHSLGRLALVVITEISLTNGCWLTDNNTTTFTFQNFGASTQTISYSYT